MIFIGICDYLGIYTTKNKLLFVNRQMHFECYGLLIAALNFFGAFFMAKLLLVQAWEWCQRKNTKKVESFSDIQRNFKTVEYSDTESMLMRSSEDWEVKSYYIN